MLKRLELVGFKSFADKTTFEFGDGITAIVGPNGSGKSNIVDAVRWILGEQSAKSLRGGEMADVIFNGSASRRSFGLAEVTMTFNNLRGHLATQNEEVQITRRVYRSGEGEYLINGQVCRLKDIKDLFLGSGAGNDAYCIIAQGKVDVLLQASTKERREIFEEAAGISRFKAKKIETLRKLERVDQNLQRVRDIIDEVEKQLRSVKLQAAKAQRYSEYSARLEELRINVGLDEYRRLTEALDREQHHLDQLRGELDQRAARAGACEAEAERLEVLLADLDDALHAEEAGLARLVQQIHSEETTIAHETTLSVDLEAELGRIGRRLVELTARVAALAEAAGKAATERDDAEAQAAQRRAEVETRSATLAETLARLETGDFGELVRLRDRLPRSGARCAQITRTLREFGHAPQGRRERSQDARLRPLRPHIPEHKSHHHHTEQDAHEPIAKVGDIGAGFETLQYGKIEGKRHLHTHIGCARAAHRDPGRRCRDCSDQQRELRDRRHVRFHEYDRGEREHTGNDATGETQSRLVNRRAGAAECNDNAGRHAGTDAGPVDCVVRDIAEHRRQRRLQRKPHVIGIREGVRHE